MKNNIYIVFMTTVFTWLSGCQQPEELIPPVSREGVNSITASFEDGTGEFTGTISETGDEIIIPVPYYFPESSNQRVMENDLKNMRVSANLDDNVTLSPSLLYMDLTQDNVVTITDQRKKTKEYTVRGEIRKLSYATIEEFEIPSLGLEGIVNHEEKTIQLIAVDPDLKPALAKVRLGYHASLSPDPTEVELDYDEDVQLTVTAQDGITQNTYTVKKEIPPKVPYGFRAGSAEIMFEKKLDTDLGINVYGLTGGIAATNDYLIINTRGQNSIFLHPKTGEKLGEIELGSVKGNLVNFYTTADDDGNIFINNLSPNDGAFKIWKLASINDTPELFIEWNGGVPIGRKVSVQGSIDKDAIITSPLNQPGNQFARWTVINGVLSSQTPEIVTINGLTKNWGNNADVIYTSPSDITSDYFLASYSSTLYNWVDGSTNSIHKSLDNISLNFVQNAVDYVEFNNAKYLVTNYVNGQPWGSADLVWLLDVSSDVNFSGHLTDGTVNSVVWESEKHRYGQGSAVEDNLNGTGDVALTVTSNGFYMYMYFMFTNGYVVGVQFDAIDM